MFDYDYIAIDLKSFYASVECMSRGLDPLSTNLVVADASRTEKTICLAVSPSLKAYGVPGRARLFEVVQRVREVNAERLQALRRIKANNGGACVQTVPTVQNRNQQRFGITAERTGHEAGAGLDAREVLYRNAADGSAAGDVFGDISGDGMGLRVENSVAPWFSLKEALFETDCTGRSLSAYRPFEQALFTESSFNDNMVRSNQNFELDYLIAKPRMAKYIEMSAQIYQVYLKYFAPEDIHVYSIDEVFIDASKYAHVHKMDTKTLASRVVADVYQATGITATAGIGTNLFLAKVAMDVLAKHEEPDENGVRIAALDEWEYKRRIWPHKPITDIWRVGKGYARKLEQHGMFTMGDVARCSLGAFTDKLNEDLLYRLFGKNAELLIDHAWGYEPVTMEEMKNYKPAVNCKASGQVLQCPYSVKKARLVVSEMADQLAFDLLAAHLETDKLTLTVGYDRLGFADGASLAAYDGELVSDGYGRTVPKHAHGTANLKEYTASSRLIVSAILDLYDRIVDARLLVRRINVSAERVISEEEARQIQSHGQLSLFDELDAADDFISGNDPACTKETRDGAQHTGGHEDAASELFEVPAKPAFPVSAAALEKERALHNTMLDVRTKFGKSAVLRAASLQEGATAMQRNRQIGGHNA